MKSTTVRLGLWLSFSLFTVSLAAASDSDSGIVEPVPPPKDVSSHQNVGLINPDFCGQGTPVRTLRGEQAELGEFPWMALLKFQTTRGGQTVDSFNCAGTLINNRYILTAGHCITNSTRHKLISVRLGDHNTTTEVDCEEGLEAGFCAPPYQDINVESVFLHPDYNARTHANDIGLIRLAQPANTTVETVRPICLPVGLAEQTKNLDGKNLILAGWGLIDRSRPDRTVLLKGSLPVMPVQQCNNVYSRFNISITGNQLCAGGVDGRKDSCRGEAGGPFMAFAMVGSQNSMVQYGLLTFGPRSCGTPGVPDVSTRVGHYMDWILNTIRA